MNFAAPFQYGKHPELEGLVQEFNLDFHKNSNQDKMIEFIQLYAKDYRINIHFTDGFDFKKAKVFKNLSENVYFRLNKEDWVSFFSLQDGGFNRKYFFDSQWAARSYSELEYMLTLGISDIYISDDLLYNLPKVKEYCSEKQVKIRVILNRIPNQYASRQNFSVKNIVFKPQDIDYIDKFFDTFEFDCIESNNQYNFNKAKILYKIFIKDKKWLGDISDFNRDWITPVVARLIYPELLQIQTTCKMRCVSENTKCHLCRDAYDLAATMEEKKLAWEKKSE